MPPANTAIKTAVPARDREPMPSQAALGSGPVLSTVAIGGGNAKAASTTPASTTPASTTAPPRVTSTDLSRFKQSLEIFLTENAITLLSVLSLVGLWYLATLALPPSIMPAPHVVADILWTQMQTEQIWSDVVITGGRIAAAFSIAMVVSLIVGFAMGISKVAERFLDVWVVCLLTMPSLVMILTIFMVVGLNEKAAVIGAALPVIAILAINIWEGIKGIDQKLIEMSRAYHAGQFRIIKSVVAPQIAPVLLASSRFGLGLIWKMVLFVELLGRSDGIGYKIEFYYQMFNMSEVLAHALLFLFIMLFIEIVLLGMLEKHLFKWRPAKRRL